MAQHRSKEEWNELLIAYENRDGTQVEFCEENGITPASLGYHLRKAALRPKTRPLVELPPQQSKINFSAGHDLMELSCHHENIGSVTIRTNVASLAEVIDQLSLK